jgi:hypothetical protein
LALDAVETGADLTAINDSYAIKVLALQTGINTPGSVTDGTSTVSFDNLPTAGTNDDTANTGGLICANGAALDTSILAALPTSITVGNASTLKSAIDNTYRPAVDAVIQVLGRNRPAFELVANFADPQGRWTPKYVRSPRTSIR